MVSGPSSGRTRGFSQSAGHVEYIHLSGNNNISSCQCKEPFETVERRSRQLVNRSQNWVVLQNDSPIYEKNCCPWKDAGQSLADRSPPEIGRPGNAAAKPVFLAYSPLVGPKQPAINLRRARRSQQMRPKNDVWWTRACRLAAELRCGWASLEASIDQPDGSGECSDSRNSPRMNLSTQASAIFERAKRPLVDCSACD